MASLQGIYAIVNGGDAAVALTQAYLEGGVRIVQYRAKNGIVPEHLRAMRALTRQHGALLLMNDDWRAALAFDCDGVHLGPGDEGFEEPSIVKGKAPHLIVGLSIGSMHEARDIPSAADYIGVGPVYATESKADAGAPIGIAGVRAIAEQTTVPVAAIGGIALEAIDAVRASGVAMAAVISALANAVAPEEAARAFVTRWERGGEV